jgi:hypothetical protein
MGFIARNAQKKAELREVCRREGHQWITLRDPALKLMGGDSGAVRIPQQVAKYCARCGEEL